MMSYRKLLLWITAGFISVIISSCDPEEPIPAYLSINNMILSLDSSQQYATQGTSSSNIKDVWVYIDGDLLGVYELPARFPVLKEGKHTILLGAGIYENGISATRVLYPLYKSFETTVDFIPGETLDRGVDTVNYFPGISYTLYEDFEGNIFSFDSILPSTTGLDPFNTDNPFEGNYSAKFVINETNNYFLGACLDSTKDINSFSTAWVELNYKAEQAFEVGLMVQKANNDITKTYALTINGSSEWKKIYINVSDIIGSNPSAKSFRVYIAAALESGRTQSTFYVDNIKLIHN